MLQYNTINKLNAKYALFMIGYTLRDTLWIARVQSQTCI